MQDLGKGLNSGIFFRCIPGQYQNGYEAQIQNAFKDDDRTKPLDFGTGAIYRRVAARKVVSNDNEWFTMTVVANGKHIATWVNGYQTVDWTDDRRPNDNPRKGYRAAKGPLSIQGHDPTTDLLFRNIRIAAKTTGQARVRGFVTPPAVTLPSPFRTWSRARRRCGVEPRVLEDDPLLAVHRHVRGERDDGVGHRDLAVAARDDLLVHELAVLLLVAHRLLQFLPRRTQ